MKRAIVLLVVFAASPTVATAQFTPIRLRPALEAPRVRLELLDGRRLSGQAIAIEPRQLRLRARVYRSIHEAEERDTAIALDSLARVWLFGGTHWRRGAMIGSGVGLALFVGFVATIGEAIAERECDAQCFAAAGGTGVLVGALVGVGVGALVVRWREL